MAAFSGYNDTPNQIKVEGQEITLRFVRNNDGTGTITWNIPAPAAGCASDGAGAYDGIVLTVSGTPANYLTNSPQNGTFYNADPTVDPDLNVGDKLDTAAIIGAFYNDKKTISLTVTGVKAKTAYYVSGYAVDSVGRYHREGVHAYSIPTGPQELTKSTSDMEATQNILIDILGGVTINASTGLSVSQLYTFELHINKINYTININGVDAQTYSDLIDAINIELMQLQNPILLPYPPNTGGFYWDAANKFLYVFDGFTNTKLDPIVSNLDPSSPIVGTYWYNPVTKILKKYTLSGWVTETFLSFPTDPTLMPCDQLWYDGVNVWQWEGNHWIKLCLYNQLRNPALAPILSCDTFWYNTTTQLLYSWDDVIQKWNEVLAIISFKNPNTLNTGDFWFNETTKFVYEFVGGIWNQLTHIRYEERNSSGGLDNPVANTYWFVPTEMKLYLRDPTNVFWIEKDTAIFPTDPRIRNSNDLWWNNSSSVIELLAWDSLNSVWVDVKQFYKTSSDPSFPPSLPDCAVWLNPSTGTLKLIRGVTCDDRSYISFPFDPTNPILYDFWYDSTNNVFKLWNGTVWVPITIVKTDVDPFALTTGEYWFDLATNILYRWNGTSFVVITYSLTPLFPIVGTLWFDIVNDKLYEWNGTTWVIGTPLAGIKFIPAPTKFGRDILQFFTYGIGCTQFICLNILNIQNVPFQLFASFRNPVMYGEPVRGNSGLDAGPMYNQLGVGDDGSPDERRAIQNSVRLALGSAEVTVELTKEQLDECINYALLTIRKYTSIAYKRGFFFLDLFPNQQTYQLTNRCVGFNKIVDINAIMRMSDAFFRTAYAGNDIFGVAALQQLYTIGAFDMLSFHMVSSYIKELEKLFASNIMFQWIEQSRELKMYQNFMAFERVLIDGVVERTEQDLMTDRELRLWIMKWSIAEAKMMLSQPRGKYQQLPGPNGSTSLNTQDLINQSQQEKEALMEELHDMSMQGIGDVGLRSHFILG